MELEDKENEEEDLTVDGGRGERKGKTKKCSIYQKNGCMQYHRIIRVRLT
jgi:hypothetical protein